MQPSEDDLYLKLKSGSAPRSAHEDLLQGRVLIERLRVPQPTPTGTVHFRTLKLQATVGVQKLERVTWKDLHFRKCDLSGLLFFGCRFENCIFERCKIRQVGFWESQIKECIFEDCDLRDAAFGGHNIEKPTPLSRFNRVRFERCDLRDGAHSAESYESCVFRGCRLDGVDFLGAVFEDCVFQGTLKDVMFRREDPSHPERPKNRLARCDFKDAKLIDCDFLNIDLDPSILPEDPDMIVVPRGPADWLEFLGHVGQHEGKRWYVQEMQGRAGTPSVTWLRDLTDGFTPEEVQAFLKIVGKA